MILRSVDRTNSLRLETSVVICSHFSLGSSAPCRRERKINSFDSHLLKHTSRRTSVNYVSWQYVFSETLLLLRERCSCRSGAGGSITAAAQSSGAELPGDRQGGTHWTSSWLHFTPFAEGCVHTEACVCLCTAMNKDTNKCTVHWVLQMTHNCKHTHTLQCF